MRKFKAAFTIVELLIVIVVIAILATITITSYNGISRSAKESALKSDLESAAKQVQIASIVNGSFPSDIDDFKKGPKTTWSYKKTASSFCIEAEDSSLADVVFHAGEGEDVTEGPCGVLLSRSGDPIQTISTPSCPSTKIMAVDARDNHTYWVQKMPDGRCWMLTNLSYAGDGVDTHGDTKPLTNGSLDTTATYTEPTYYIPVNANSTTKPAVPSESTDGGATAPQYGYFYNFCAANGGQANTNACLSAGEPLLDNTISICPSGWRLPIAVAFGENEFRELNDSVKGSLAPPAGLEAQWLAQRGGYWYRNFSSQGTSMRYWSSSQYTSPTYFGGYTLTLYEPSYDNGSFYTASGIAKNFAQAVRCIAR